MASLDCRELGCRGDGMISCIYVNKVRKTFRYTSRCCPKCNHHHRDIATHLEGEELLAFGITESNLRADGYRDVHERLVEQVTISKIFSVG